jgi:opacity protein-like surface antigen
MINPPAMKKQMLFVVVIIIGLTASLANAQTDAKSPWSFSASLSAKETFDDNVFLQDHSYLSHRTSMVSTFTPSFALGYQGSAAFKLAVSYTPEATFYHSYSSENNVAHRGVVNLSGKSGNTAWELNNVVTGIAGSDRGVTFDTAHGGDIPALGGIPIRDRRDAIVYRNSVKVTQTVGKWFLRPVFTSYVHDFKTAQSTVTGYENYVDRYEVNGGLDVGYEAYKKTHVVLGYRYGYQHQGELNGTSSPYSSNYHRILVGVEGSPTDWLKLNLSAGPDIRDFPSSTLPTTFDKRELLWYVDASATASVGKNDSVSVLLTRYEQPAFSSQSVYEDVVYSINWKHLFNEKISATAGFKAYQGDWQKPVIRDDWIFTPSLGLNYAVNKHLSADLSWSYDTVRSEVNNKTGREFTRNLLSLGAKYTF